MGKFCLRFYSILRKRFKNKSAKSQCEEIDNITYELRETHCKESAELLLKTYWLK